MKPSSERVHPGSLRRPSFIAPASAIFAQKSRVLFVLVVVSSLVRTAGAQTYLTADQVAQAAYGVGFRAGALVNSIAIAKAESNFRLDAECNSCYQGVTEDSCGLWQINIDVHTGYDKSQLLSSASYNATAAYQISGAAVDASWVPWSTFQDGFGTDGFVQYLSMARTAAQGVDATVIQSINDTVSATTGIEVHTSAGIVLPKRTVSSGTTGTVIDGPQVSALGNGTYIFVWWKIHWNDGGADGWSVEDYMIRTGTTQPTVEITFATSPAGLQSTVDGITYTTPVTFNWSPGDPHTVSQPTPQFFGLYSLYEFSGAQNQTFTTPSSSATNTADFSTQYYLTMSAGTGGSVSPDGGWYDSGTGVEISATASGGYTFNSWTGTGSDPYSGISTTALVTMDGPIFETANFSDATPPTPNPSTWATVPYATGTTSISMTATTASDPSGVQYFFQCLTTGGHDSVWLASVTYQDTGLSPNTTYTYQVVTRDQSAAKNQGTYSTSASATTQQVADTTPPTPNPSTWATVPYATGTTSISMTATTASDLSGVQYFFQCLTAGGHDSAWQSTATYQDTGLLPNTTYMYQVVTRDQSPAQNQGSYSTSVSATTQQVASTSIITLSGNLAFGSVTIGSLVENVLAISNSGTSTLNVSNLNCPIGFSGTWSGSIAPGSFNYVLIKFAQPCPPGTVER